MVREETIAPRYCLLVALQPLKTGLGNLLAPLL